MFYCVCLFCRFFIVHDFIDCFYLGNLCFSHRNLLEFKFLFGFAGLTQHTTNSLIIEFISIFSKSIVMHNSRICSIKNQSSLYRNTCVCVYVDTIESIYLYYKHNYGLYTSDRIHNIFLFLSSFRVWNGTCCVCVCVCGFIFVSFEFGCECKYELGDS